MYLDGLLTWVLTRLGWLPSRVIGDLPLVSRRILGYAVSPFGFWGLCLGEMGVGFEELGYAPKWRMVVVRTVSLVDDAGSEGYYGRR
jgi:hypothetical protein